MTTSLTQELAAQLQGAPVRQMSQQLGLDPAQTQAAIGAALPLLLGALGRNASQPQGAEALFGALRKDHAGAGGLGEVLGAVLGGARPDGAQSRQTDGAGILDHVFGARQSRAEQAVGQATGVGQDKAGMLLRWLAPIVLAYLAKRMFDQRQPSSTADAQQAPSPDVLGGILGEETRQVERQSGGLLGGVLGQVLDRDGDGDTDFSDLMQVGGAILGGQRAR